LNGNLAADAEVVDLGEKGKLITCRVGTRRFRRAESDETDWFSVSAYVPVDTPPEKVEARLELLSKGRWICIQDGELILRSWETEDGGRRYAPQIRVRSMYSLLLDPRAQTKAQVEAENLDDDEDVPF